MKTPLTTHHIKKILVPVDFSQVSLSALRTAISICKRQLATLTLLHVVEDNYVVTHAMHGIPFGTVQSELVAIARENLNTLARETRSEHDLVVSHVVQSGKPSDIIATLALDEKIDLIVMGSNGLTRWREFFLGSTTFRVIKTARCPVLSVPDRAKALTFKKILFPVRMVPNALDKYQFLRPIIKKNKSTLMIAGVMTREDNSEGEMTRMIDTLKNAANADEVEFSSELYRCDDVANQVLAISIVENPDLLIITATLNSTWRELFPGTYVQEIVSHATCPVLSIPNQYTENLSAYSSYR